MHNNIRKLRLKEGISQQTLAERIGTTRATIMKLEKGDMGLTTLWMEKIAKGLKCSMRDIIDNDNDHGELRDSEIALIDAIKDIIQIMTLTNQNVPGMLRNAFSYQRAEYEEGNLKGAVQVMELLGKFVGEQASAPEQKLIRRLLQIAPVGSA